MKIIARGCLIEIHNKEICEEARNLSHVIGCGERNERENRDPAVGLLLKANEEAAGVGP